MITKIEWTATLIENHLFPGYTFNPWWGCEKISPGCKFCYAESFDKRWGGDHWGPKSTRRKFGVKHWNEPLKWNEFAKSLGYRLKVFCASMADWAEDNDSIVEERAKLFELIKATPYLNWLLLTKRSDENLIHKLPPDWGKLGYHNVWLGCSVENQEQTKRIKHLINVPAPIHFLSCEPLLGPVDITNKGIENDYSFPTRYEEFGNTKVPVEWTDPGPAFIGVDWVICGGESGPSARPMHPMWAESLRKQCDIANVPFFFKQWGEWQDGSNVVDHKYKSRHIVMLKDGVLAEWDVNGTQLFADEIKMKKRYTVEEWNRLIPRVMAKVGKGKSGRALENKIYDNMPTHLDKIL